MFDILIVEDSLTDRMILKMYLDKSGLRVGTAPNAERALEIIKQYQSLVVITDIVLPGMSGFQLCRKLKQCNLNDRDFSVIICSSKNNKVDKLWAEKLGADDYFTKPFDLEKIFKKVKELLILPERGYLTLLNDERRKSKEGISTNTISQGYTSRLVEEKYMPRDLVRDLCRKQKREYKNYSPFLVPSYKK